MRLISKSSVLAQTMDGNLLPINSISFLNLMESYKTFLLQGLPNKMELLKGKIELLKRKP
jgi:hypothetical protein